MDERYEDISFKNLVNYYREELEEINHTGAYPTTMKKHIRTKLRRYGLLGVEKGHKSDLIYLTDKTIESLTQTRK
jgi:hypothetical protein